MRRTLEQEGMLPAMVLSMKLLGQQLHNSDSSAFRDRHTGLHEASLVKKLRRVRDRRPSTYAPTISTIQNRKYVEKGSVDGSERKYTLWTYVEWTN